jgi:oligopeptide transport system substrate-binding protein
MGRKRLIIPILVILAASLVGCGGSQSAGKAGGPKVLTVGWPYEPASMDPHRANEDAAYNALRMMVEGLVRNVKGQAAPGVAKSWDVSKDNMEYTFHLRKSVFSDGSPVTAADFQYSLMRLLDPAKGYEKADAAFIIKNAERYYKGECPASEVGIEVKGDYTLKLTLAVPTFPVVFADWPFAPMKKDFVEEKGAQYGTEAANLLTNGPFTLETWEHNSKLVLVKNPKYWNAGAIALSEIDALINAAGDTAVDMMLAHSLDLVELINIQQATALTDGGFLVDSYASNYQFLHVNHKGKTPATGRFLSNVNFRRAFNYAIDRSALVATVYTTSLPATRLTAANELGVKGSFNTEYPYEAWPASADVAKAKEFLDKALQELGATAKDIPTFTMLCYDSQSSLMALQAIQDMLRKNLGVVCVLDPQPLPSMIAKAYGSDYDFWKGGSSLGEVDWLSSVATAYYSNKGAPYNYADKQFDALYDKAAAATAWKDRKAAMFDLEKYFCDNVVDILLTWQQEYVVHDAKVSGLTMSTYLDYTFADVKN